MRRRALARRKQRPKTTRKSISPSTAACNAATANLQEIIVKAIVIGSGTIGSAVKKALEENGHKVVSIGRKSGDFQADISNPESLKALFTSIGPFDAVANAAGDVFPGPFEQTTDEQWANSIKSKGMGQINLVQTALPFIADKGSFTLVSGVLTDEYMHGGTIGTTINHLVEGFVKASAVELPRGVRINCISPTVLTESVAYHAYFTGFTPVPAAEVALAYLRAISTPITGRILKLHKTDS
jgi:NAD(P)-dependent dehydrogenase (short-subunit alcohol dehydrogenase family)